MQNNCLTVFVAAQYVACEVQKPRGDRDWNVTVICNNGGFFFFLSTFVTCSKIWRKDCKRKCSEMF